MKSLDTIQWSKGNFNKFFQKDLYGRFDSDDNIILSRGSWEDSHVVFPKLYSFCLNYSLKKHWAGYSDSLGHDHAFEAISKYVNVGMNKIKNYYSSQNIAITMGNVFALNQVFNHLKTITPNAEILALKPFYPSILKSASRSFKTIKFINSLNSEGCILNDISKKLTSKRPKILLLTNAIGVEGRIFSVEFWKEILSLINDRDVYLIIDEGMWFSPLEYPTEINSEKVIRVVSFSKKFGIPGLKLGFMLAGDKYIGKYYEWASSSYGGPPSIFFLIIEFICRFEYINLSKLDINSELKIISSRYGISISKLLFLYTDFIKSVTRNQTKLKTNQKLLQKWLRVNGNLVKKQYDFGGINVLIEPSFVESTYDLFLRLIKKGTSIFPGSCIGDVNDSLFRITLLEKTSNFKKGLKLLSTTLKEYV